MRNIKLIIINFLQKINLFYFFYSKIIFIRRFLFKKKKVEFKNKFILVSDKDSDIFLGYYDINNFSNDQQKILFHQKPKSEKYINISVYDYKKKDIKILDQSFAWSWQLGSRLKWLTDKELIFNNVDSNKNLICKSLNIENRSFKNFSFPFFSISKNNRFAATLNFKKLETCRPGYGYSFSQQNFKDDENFLYIWDLKTNEILKVYNENFFDDNLKKFFKEYYFNHISWSPNNQNFILYAIDRFSRSNKLIFFQNLEKYEILNNVEIISHHEWINENEILFFGKIEKFKSFFRYNLKNKKFVKLNFNLSNHDGHPHTSDGNLFVIDTYPNQFQQRYLYTFDLKLNELKVLGNAYNNFYLTNGKKCDFHPKISKNNELILIDTSHNLKREFLILEN